MISIIVPVHNEAGNILPLLEEIDAISGQVPLTEIIYIDDASTDGTAQELEQAKDKYPKLRVLRHSQKCGQSTGLWTGATHAKGTILITLDGDGQNAPGDIPKVYATYEKSAKPGKRVMVAGQREKRHDSLVRKISSRLANKIRSTLLQDGVRDTGCSLKLFRRDDYLALPYFNHMHRYIPALMQREGVEVALIDVSHRPRTVGTSKYGIGNRLWVGIHDLIGVMWLQRRKRLPIQVTEV